MQPANFDWQEWDDTDMAGPSWDNRAEELMREFKTVLDKELSSKIHTLRENVNKQWMLF
jgi:hypothetical protein